MATNLKHSELNNKLKDLRKLYVAVGFSDDRLVISKQYPFTDGITLRVRDKYFGRAISIELTNEEIHDLCDEPFGYKVVGANIEHPVAWWIKEYAEGNSDDDRERHDAMLHILRTLILIMKGYMAEEMERSEAITMPMYSLNNLQLA